MTRTEIKIAASEALVILPEREECVFFGMAHAKENGSRRALTKAIREYDAINDDITTLYTFIYGTIHGGQKPSLELVKAVIARV